MTLSPAARHDLLETLETQRLGCELAGSPLYASILEQVAADVREGGPYASLLEPVAQARYGDAVALRLMGALHLLVLEGRAPGLARHYPSAGGSSLPLDHGELRLDLLAVAEAHGAELGERLVDGVQTNEVGRCAALLGGYLEVARLGLPLRVLELGASAGLNLAFDRYRYVDGDQAFGPADSPLVFDHPWYFGAPDLAVSLVVAQRRGCDRNPLDVTTHEGRQRLRSFVWADQLDRLQRLDAALVAAAADPPHVDRADAAEWIEEQLAEPVPGVCTVVTHAIVLQYLSSPRRRRVLEAIERAGARADARAPVAWLRLEPGGDQAELRLTSWPGGGSRLLAKSAYHGPPVVWWSTPGESLD